MAEPAPLWMYPLLTALGCITGTYGTLVGAGGGVILVPALLLLYPHEPPNTIASISLAVVFFNALSGTLAYGHMQRIDYRAGLFFGAAAVPGAILGAFVASLLSRRAFDLIFSLLVLALAAFLLLRPTPGHVNRRVGKRETTHILTDSKGVSFSYSFSIRRGVLFSFVIGLIASTLGIGGGPFQVPVLVYLLHFPLHVATATSQFMLMIMSLVGSVAHIVAGNFDQGFMRVLFLSLGVLVGAQLGARLSERLTGTSISRILAGGLILIGIRLAIHAFEN